MLLGTLRSTGSGCSITLLALPLREYKIEAIVIKRIFPIIVVLLSLSSSACVGVGYSRGSGWFVWPGGLGLLLVIIVVVLLLRRRRR